jgi:hypothetical protein
MVHIRPPVYYLLCSFVIFKINRIKFFQKLKEQTPLFENTQPAGLATPATAISPGISLRRSPWRAGKAKVS